jgi:hypothetical protein
MRPRYSSSVAQLTPRVPGAGRQPVAWPHLESPSRLIPGEALMDTADKSANFLHCLPAH